MHFTTFEGSHVGYRKDGTRPALVLVHGIGGDGAANWQGITDVLARDFTVLRPDYTGSGETEDDGRVLSVDYFADQVMAAVDDADTGDFALVGFSLGAAVATRIAADHPDRVRHLFLIAGFAKPGPLRVCRRLSFVSYAAMASASRAA